MAFKDAVYRGDVDRLRALFEERPELTEHIDAPWFHFDKPAIVEAAAACNRQLVDALLELGADIDARSAWPNGPYSALHSLVDGPTPERLSFAQYLVDRGAEIDLHAAAGLGRADVIERILAAEPERVSEPGPDGATPLHLAKDPSIVALLLEHGAEIDKRCVDHRSTAAMWATQGREDVMRFLVEQGARADLFMAVLLDDGPLAERILRTEPGAIDVRVTFGRSHEHVGYGDKYVWTLGGADTPLELARRRGRDAIYAFLLERSSPSARIVQACRRGDVTELRSLMAEPGALAAMESWEVCQALCGSAATARVMLESGADPGARDDGPGATALHHAAWRGQVDLARALLEGGADPTVRDRAHDSTPLGWAEHNHQTEMVALLEARM